MKDPILETAPLGFPWVTLDPFLFCVHHDDAYPKGNEQLGPAASLAGRNIGQDFEGIDGWRMYHGETVPGFPQHPHRGFETVTIARRGFIDHSDSLGATARFGRGDVQWMTAGKGIVHCEMFPLIEVEQANPVELFQIWLNLPKADKMVEPHFSMFWDETIPRVVTNDEGKMATVTVYAGKLGDAKAPPPPPHSWANRPEADIAIWSIVLEPGASFSLPPAKDESTNRVLYFFAGDALSIGGRTLDAHCAAVLKSSVPADLRATGEAKVEILVLQGRPIGEPTVAYGPFVMNSKAEIQQAMLDYQRTRFGGWPWKKDDPVHARTEGRFAKHADGRLERPEADTQITSSSRTVSR
ncbi:pirin family protein [soil metagenome]